MLYNICLNQDIKIPDYIARDKHKDITLAIIARGISQHNHFSRRSIALLTEAGRNPSGIGRLLVQAICQAYSYNQLFTYRIHGLRYVTVDITYFFTSKVKTIGYRYVYRQMMQFMHNQVEILFRTSGLGENGNGFPKHIITEGKPVVHLSIGEILVSLA